MCTGAFWVAQVDVYEMLAKGNDFGGFAIVLVNCPCISFIIGMDLF